MTRNLFSIVSSQFIAQLVLLLSIPVISRYYSPQDYGIFAIFSSISWILISVATSKTEALIITMDSKEKAASLSLGILSLIILFGISFALFSDFLFQNLFTNFFSSEYYFLGKIMAFTIVIMGFSQTLNCYATYLGIFVSHSYASILNAFAIVIISIGYAFFFPSKTIFLGLIYAQLISHIISFFVFLYFTKFLREISIQGFKSSFAEISKLLKKIPILLFTQLFSTASARIPTLIVSSLSGLSGAGFLGLAERIVSAPTNIFGHAVGQVVRHRYAKLFKTKKDYSSFPKMVISYSFLILFVIYATLFFLTDYVVPIILGPEWGGVIIFLKIIICAEFFNFLFLSVEDISIIRNKFLYRMILNFLYLLFLILIYLFIENSEVSYSVESILIIIYTLRSLSILYDLSVAWKCKQIC